MGRRTSAGVMKAQAEVIVAELVEKRQKLQAKLMQSSGGLQKAKLNAELKSLELQLQEARYTARTGKSRSVK